MATTILVVDDERESAQMLSRFFEASGYEVLSASEGVEALRLAKENRVDLMITDLKMPRMDGITLLKEMQTVSPQTVGIVVTGFATVDTAVEAMKVGAFDYVSKPFQLEEIRLAVQRALDHRRLKEENVSLKQQLRKKYRFENIVGDHPKMQELFRLERLLDEVDRTAADRGNGGIDIAVAGEDDDRKLGFAGLDRVEDLKPVHRAAMQPHVEQHQRGPLLVDRRQRRLAVSGRAAIIALVAEHAGDKVANVSFIINYQYVERHLASEGVIWVIPLLPNCACWPPDRRQSSW